MKTDDLIQQLGKSLAPVQRLAPPGERATLWLLCGCLYLGMVVLAAWLRGRSLGWRGDGVYVIQQFALLGTAVVASVAAFMSVIPGASRRGLAAPVLPGALVVMVLLWGCLADVQAYGTLGVGREADWPCVLSLTVGGVALWVLAMVMLRRGASLAPRISSLLAGVAALSVANMEACLSRPHMFNITVLLWHGVTTAMLIAVLMQLGSRLLPWRRFELR